MLKLSSNGKGMIFGPSVKSIMAPMEHSLMVHSLNEKGMILRKITFQIANGHG